MQKYLTTVLRTVAALMFTLMLGCAGAADRTQDLLVQDYQAMEDQEILTYYYQLSDQIAREERVTTGTSVGVGVGRGPVHIGERQGVTRFSVAEDLRNRRSEVQAELTQRGLSP